MTIPREVFEYAPGHGCKTERAKWEEYPNRADGFLMMEHRWQGEQEKTTLKLYTSMSDFSSII